jgi:hypothetical protein
MFLQSKVLWWLFNLKAASTNCTPEVRIDGFKNRGHFFTVSHPAKISPKIVECSGMVATSKDSTFWVHNDGGNKAELFEIDRKGKLLSILPLTTTKNIDWEEITRDDKGNIYIGDFGNNANNRKDLTIYKFPENQPDKMEKITFNYAYQKQFPPTKSELNYDCEAFFALGDSLYLFTKNRGNKAVRMYALSTQAGNYSITHKDDIFIKTMVTGAAISPDKRTFALLTYGKVFLFGFENQQVNFKKPIDCFKFAHQQAEAIVFITNKKLMISNEQGELFTVSMER